MIFFVTDQAQTKVWNLNYPPLIGQIHRTALVTSAKTDLSVGVTWHLIITVLPNWVVLNWILWVKIASHGWTKFLSVYHHSFSHLYPFCCPLIWIRNQNSSRNFSNIKPVQARPVSVFPYSGIPAVHFPLHIYLAQDEQDNQIPSGNIQINCSKCNISSCFSGIQPIRADFSVWLNQLMCSFQQIVKMTLWEPVWFGICLWYQFEKSIEGRNIMCFSHG